MSVKIAKNPQWVVQPNPGGKQEGIKSLPLGHPSSGFITKRKITGDHQGGKIATDGPPTKKTKREIPLKTRLDRHAISLPGTPNGKHVSGGGCRCGGCITGQKKK